MRTKAAVSALLSFCLAGCGPSHLALLKRQAAGDLHCDPERLVATDQDYVGTVRGCGKENAYIWHDERWSSAFGRATVELGCPAAELSARVLAARTIVVSGCGKRAIYIASLMGDWVLNGEVQ